MDLFARPAETTRLTEPGCPIASIVAVQLLLTAVWVRRRIASYALR